MDIKIPNYLKTLINSKSDVYLCDGFEFLNVSLFSKLHGNNIISIAKKANISGRMVYRYISGEKHCSLRNLEIISQTLGIEGFLDDLFDNSFTFSAGRSAQFVLPKYYSLELAYLVGFIAGDGHISKRPEIQMVNDSKEVLLKIIPNFCYKVFNCVPKTYKVGIYFVAYLYSKPVHLFMNKVIGLPQGKKKGVLRVPKFIYLSKELKKYFLRGLFDSDGGVTVDKFGKTSILYSSSTLVFLQEVNCLLRDFSINLGGPYQSGNREGYELRSYSKSEIKNFFTKIGSYHLKKINRMKASVA